MYRTCLKIPVASTMLTALTMRVARLREKVPIGLLLAAIGAIKFGFDNKVDYKKT